MSSQSSSGRATMRPFWRVRRVLLSRRLHRATAISAGCGRRCVTDDIHAWVGQEAAASAGLPISLNNLTDDERTLRDLAFPLIEPPYDRAALGRVLYEYGYRTPTSGATCGTTIAPPITHMLAGPFHRSTSARYNQLIDDIRNDIVRIDPFFAVARQSSISTSAREQHAYVVRPDPRSAINAHGAHRREQLTIAWVQHSLTERCATYRFALEHLVVAEPAPAAVDADADADAAAAADRSNAAGARPPRIRRPAALPRRRVRQIADKIYWSARGGIARRPARGAPSASGRAPAPSARTTIRPVVVGDSTISRSAAVTSSSSGSSSRCCGRHQVELDGAAAGGAVVDRVIGDVVARVERDRGVGLAHRHGELDRPVARDRSGRPPWRRPGP